MFETKSKFTNVGDHVKNFYKKLPKDTSGEMNQDFQGLTKKTRPVSTVL